MPVQRHIALNKRAGNLITACIKKTYSVGRIKSEEGIAVFFGRHRDMVTLRRRLFNMHKTPRIVPLVING